MTREVWNSSFKLVPPQVPIFQPRSDGNNNLLCAILIAATQHIPEVTVFFGAKLFRGTRYLNILLIQFPIAGDKVLVIFLPQHSGRAGDDFCCPSLSSMFIFSTLLHGPALQNLFCLACVTCVSAMSKHTPRLYTGHFILLPCLFSFGMYLVKRPKYINLLRQSFLYPRNVTKLFSWSCFNGLSNKVPLFFLPPG